MEKIKSGTWLWLPEFYTMFDSLLSAIVNMGNFRIKREKNLILKCPKISQIDKHDDLDLCCVKDHKHYSLKILLGILICNFLLYFHMVMEFRKRETVVKITVKIECRN